MVIAVLFFNIFVNMERETRNLTGEECAQAVVLVEVGWSFRRIGQRFNVAHTTVSRVIQRYREAGNHVRRPGQGRNRITTPINDRYLRLSTLRQRFVTARSLQMQLREVSGLQISGETIRQRLRAFNLRPRVAARGPALTRDHRRARLNFATDHVNWPEDQWERVLFTDESRFCLYNNDRRLRVYRRPNERYSQCNFSNTTLFGGGSVMVWAGISLTGRTELVLINGSLTAERYILEILDNHVVPYAPYIGQGFMLMHDNARPHVARVVQHYLEQVGIDTMAWPARSPDLNPIEHLWDKLGRKLQEELNQLDTLADVGRKLVQIWEELDQNEIRSLILSMNRRCQEVIRGRGGNTRY